MENKFGEKIKCLRLDKENEYDSIEFKKFNMASEIKMKKTILSMS